RHRWEESRGRISSTVIINSTERHGPVEGRQGDVRTWIWNTRRNGGVISLRMDGGGGAALGKTFGQGKGVRGTIGDVADSVRGGLAGDGRARQAQRGRCWSDEREVEHIV